jgi:perosamine synthetase
MLTRIPLSAPDIDEQDIAAVTGVLRTTQLSLGPMLDRFEREFATYIGSKQAIAVSSGTAGLHLCLLALGIGPGDEVIVPSFTFIAAANAIRYVGAIPVFVDINAATLNMDAACVARVITLRTRALLIVHTFGVPADLESLSALAADNNLLVIEDACEAIGADIRGRKVGTFGAAGVFGFYPNKQITTGEGGMIVTNDPSVSTCIRSLRNQGRTAGEWLEHSRLGYNYRLSEMSCALGLAQLHRISDILTMRAKVASLYDNRLRANPHLVLPALQVPDRVISWFVYVVRLGSEFTRAQRDAVIDDLAKRGIACGRYFAPIHLQGAYASACSPSLVLPVTQEASERTIALPFFNRMTEGQIAEVSDCLLAAIDSVKSIDANPFEVSVEILNFPRW